MRPWAVPQVVAEPRDLDTAHVAVGDPQLGLPVLEPLDEHPREMPDTCTYAQVAFTEVDSSLDSAELNALGAGTYQDNAQSDCGKRPPIRSTIRRAA